MGVGPRFVVVLGELVNHLGQMMLAKGDEMIETVGLDGLNKSVL